MSGPPRVRVEERGPARVLVIDNPAKRNALDFQALEELEVAFARATRDGVRCLVLRGAGDDAFSSGFDIAEMALVSGRGDRPDEAVERTADVLSEVPCPTLAFLNGFAFGGAFELAATCDLRVARAGVKLAMTPAKLGVVYPEGGLRRFADLVGAARTRELFFTGRPIDAETALSWGLVNRVSPVATAEADALALAVEIAGERAARGPRDEAHPAAPRGDARARALFRRARRDRGPAPARLRERGPARGAAGVGGAAAAPLQGGVTRPVSAPTTQPAARPIASAATPIASAIRPTRRRGGGGAGAVIAGASIGADGVSSTSGIFTVAAFGSPRAPPAAAAARPARASRPPRGWRGRSRRSGRGPRRGAGGARSASRR